MTNPKNPAGWRPTPALILVLAFAWAFAMIIILANALTWAVDLPTVYVSATTDECIHVETWTPEDAKKGYSCKNLPDRYERLLVDPDWQKTSRP